MNEEIKNIVQEKKYFVFILLGLVSVFFVVLIISGVVDIGKKVKEARYIGQNLSRNILTISETGEVQAKPDLVIINFSVVNEAKTATEAMDNNSKLMNDVAEAMKKAGIDAKDLKTLTFNISPRYEYPSDKEYYSGKRVLAGYDATNQLEVKIRDLSKIGVIIETATMAGANEVASLQMVIENKDSLKVQAREQAIIKAKARAQSMASDLEVKLGKVISFSENYYLPYEAMSYSGKAMDASSIAPQIETGENKISASVVITYEIF
jgi:uncharacterized protein